MKFHQMPTRPTDYNLANCLDMDPEEFNGVGTYDAHVACRTCPIRPQCRHDADNEETFGVYRGGRIFADYGRPAPTMTGPRKIRRLRVVQ